MELEGDDANLEAFRRGDRQTLAALYEAHLGAVEALLRGGFTFTSRGATVRFRGFDEPFRLQEAIQEGFMRAFRKEAREAYDGKRPWRPYLITIVRNHVIDQFRKRQTERRYFVSLSSAAPEAASEQEALEQLQQSDYREAPSSPEATTFQGQLKVVLAAFLEDLEPEDMQVVRRHMLGELTQQQMADELGESRNDVRKRIRQIRARLLRHLKREGVIGSLDRAEVFRDLTILAGVLVR